MPRLRHSLVSFMDVSPAVSDPSASFLALCSLGWVNCSKFSRTEAPKVELLGEPWGQAQPGLSLDVPKPSCVFVLCCSSACPAARRAGGRGFLRRTRPPVSVASLFYLHLFNTLSLLSVLPSPLPCTPRLLGCRFSPVPDGVRGCAHRARRARPDAGREREVPAPPALPSEALWHLALGAPGDGRGARLSLLPGSWWPVGTLGMATGAGPGPPSVGGRGQDLRKPFRMASAFLEGLFASAQGTPECLCLAAAAAPVAREPSARAAARAWAQRVGHAGAWWQGLWGSKRRFRLCQHTACHCFLPAEVGGYPALSK